MQDLLARRVRNIEVEILAEVLTLPKRQCFCVLLIIAVGDEGVADSKSARHVPDQRRKKIAPSSRSGANNNRAERLFGKMPVGNVADESNHADNVALAIAVGSEGARLPNIVALGGVLRDESV